ncbi:hypothetical protein HZ994_04510 [Akkermansiaceae bacterium]|nr:hypothetical protein HZ994_04510 [Akkermansiaceae bacterium]
MKSLAHLLVAGMLALLARAGEKSGHLFILSGQSNMTGSLRKGFTDRVAGSLGEDEVMIVQCSRAGRGIRFWVADYAPPEGHELQGRLTGGNGEEFLRLAKAVRDSCDARTFKTVTLIWMQGESDASRDLGAAYGRSFITLTGRLKKELGIEEMHFVIGRISDYGLHGDAAEGWKRMRAVQQKIAEDDPLGSWIDTDDLNGGDAAKPEGDLHYPSGESVKLGERFGEAALRQLADAKAR